MRRLKWLHEDRRIRPGFELEQFRPFLGPYRLRLVRAIRWLFRTLDRVQTVKTPRNGRKTPCFGGFGRPHLRRRISPNYTPSAPELRLIATQLSDQIGCIKRCVSVPGKSMSKRSAKSVAALFVSVMAGADLATVTDLRAQAATADDCLTAPKGADLPGQPLVLPHRSRDQTSVLVSSRGGRQGQRQVHPRHAAGFTAGDFGGSRGAG